MSPVVAIALMGSLALAACGTQSDAEYFSRQWARERDAAQERAAPPPGTRLATPAESACLNAAVVRHSWAPGIVSTEEVAGPGGRPSAVRVVVNIARQPGQVVAFPCTYDAATGRVSA